MFGRKTNRSFDEKRIKDSQRFSSASTVKVPSSVRIEEDQFIPTFSPDYNENEEGPSFSTSDYPSGNETPLPAGRYRLAIVFLKIDPLSNVITAGTTDHVFPFIASKPFSSIEIHQFPYNQQGQLYDIGIALASDSPKINSPFVVYDVIPAITLTSFRSSPEGGRSLRLCPVWYHARPHVLVALSQRYPKGGQLYKTTAAGTSAWRIVAITSAIMAVLILGLGVTFFVTSSQKKTMTVPEKKKE